MTARSNRDSGCTDGPLCAASGPGGDRRVKLNRPGARLYEYAIVALDSLDLKRHMEHRMGLTGSALKVWNNTKPSRGLGEIF